MQPNLNDTSEDFISLSGIKQFMLDAFNLLFKFLDFILKSLRYSLLLFLSFCIIGLLGGIVYNLLVPTYFKTEMIVFTNALPKKTYNEIVTNLDQLLTTQSYRSFSEELGLDTTIPKKIIHIETLSINNEPLKADTSTKIDQPFKVQVLLNDNSIVDTLQKALLYYFNNNKYLRQSKQGIKNIYLEKLDYINFEQKKLDSLQDIYNKNLSTQRMPSTFYNNALNPADLYRMSYELANQKELILRWLSDQQDGVVLIDGFKKSQKIKSNSKYIPLIIGFSIGFLIGLIISILIYLRKKVIKIVY